jgi:autotransporter-associated beta strand protein
MKTLAPFIRPSRRILCGSITALVVAMGFSALRADTQTWSPGSALWDLNAANWNGGAVWSNGNDALFESSGTAFQSLTLGTGVLAGNLTFGTSGYAISGGSLTLTGGVIETQPGVFATVEASLEGGVGLTKTGAGTLFLSGVNTYTGGTVVSAGSLRIVDDENLGAASGGLTLSGGVLQSAFVSLDRTVAVSGTGGFQVDRNGNSQVAGVLSGSGVLSKLGDGELRLSGVNTFGGSVMVEGGSLRLRASQNGGLFNYAPSLASAMGYTIRARGNLFADASALTTIAAPDFLSDTAGITLDGGRLSYSSSNAAGNFLETVGDLNLTGRHSSLMVTRTHASSSVVLALGALSQSVSDATVNFQSTNGVLGTAGNNPRITFRTAPSLNDGLIGGWALANTTDFATYTGTGGASDLGVSAATYYTGAIGSAAAADNVRVTAGNGTVATLGDLTINSLVFAATASTPVILQTAGTTLTLDTGGLIFSGAFNSTLGSSGAFLTSNSGALYLHKNDQPGGFLSPKTRRRLRFDQLDDHRQHRPDQNAGGRFQPWGRGQQHVFGGHFRERRALGHGGHGQPYLSGHGAGDGELGITDSCQCGRDEFHRRLHHQCGRAGEPQLGLRQLGRRDCGQRTVHICRRLGAVGKFGGSQSRAQQPDPGLEPDGDGPGGFCTRCRDGLWARVHHGF